MRTNCKDCKSIDGIFCLSFNMHYESAIKICKYKRLKGGKVKPVYIDDLIHEKIKALATKNKRHLHGEVEMALLKHLDDEALK